MRRGVFWGSIGAIGYAYAGFPLLLCVRAVVAPRPWTSHDRSQPSVTVVIAAHNEERAIASKVRNVLDLDYPVELLDCVVVSDGSTDRTVESARDVGSDRITVLELPRSGKATALNRGIGRATGEILVFTDANSRLAIDAITRLVAPFGDPDVGGVAGDQRYDDGVDASGERAYWSFDRLLKVAESRAGNVISATGALYAIRRELAVVVPDGVTDDFAVSTGVIEHGRRLVFEPRAIAYEPPAVKLGGEYRRKVRVMTRGLRSVYLRRRLLDPRLAGFYSLQLLSHKVIRRLVVVPLALALWSSLSLRRQSAIYRLAALGQLAVYGVGTAGLVASPARWTQRRVVAIPAFFVLVNAASLNAVWNVLTGHRIDLWTPERSTLEDPRA